MMMLLKRGVIVGVMIIVMVYIDILWFWIFLIKILVMVVGGIVWLKEEVKLEKSWEIEKYV